MGNLSGPYTLERLECAKMLRETKISYLNYILGDLNFCKIPKKYQHGVVFPIEAALLHVKI